jgi:hypothetical protein
MHYVMRKARVWTGEVGCRVFSLGGNEDETEFRQRVVFRLMHRLTLDETVVLVAVVLCSLFMGGRARDRLMPGRSHPGRVRLDR